MAENTKIEYADATFNVWRGCERYHVGCTHCYAATLAKLFPQMFGVWGPEKAGGRRVLADLARVSRSVRRMNQKAACTCGCCAEFPGHHQDCPQADRPIVFWNDVSDTFEDWSGPMMDSRGTAIYTPNCERPHPNDPADHRQYTMTDARRWLFGEIDACPNLTHLLVTKRPENVRRMWMPRDNEANFGEYAKAFTEREAHRADSFSFYRPNVWLLYSASDQASLEAGLPHLLACRDLVNVLGLSLEPLVGPVDVLGAVERWWRAMRGAGTVAAECFDLRDWLGWLACGGESGPKARPCKVEWIRSIVRQCREAGTPCFVKQCGADVRGNFSEFRALPNCPNGKRLEGFGDFGDGVGFADVIRLVDPKGGDPAEWPEDLRVREMPRA